MPTKAKEIRSNPNGDRRACPYCNPKPNRVPMDRLWEWSLKNPGKKVFRADAR